MCSEFSIRAMRLGAALEESPDALGVEVEVVQAVDRRAVDRNRNEQVLDTREHAVLVRQPLGERAQVVDHVLRVGVEDMRAVLMEANSIRTERVVRVARDVRPFVDHQDACSELAREPLGDRAAGQAGADHEEVVHLISIPPGCLRTGTTAWVG